MTHYPRLTADPGGRERPATRTRNLALQQGAGIAGGTISGVACVHNTTHSRVYRILKRHNVTPAA